MQVVDEPGGALASPSFLFQPAQLYDYQPLPSQSRCIRLLKLNTKNHNGPLSATLEVVDLRNSPHFSALSYVWGKYSNLSPTISCQGCRIEITPSCHDALVALRGLADGVPIWVDAVCINQKDTSEKEAQIQLMEEVFSLAQAVYIWLGRDDERGSAQKAIACLKLASQLCLRPIGLPWHGGFGLKTVFKDRMKLFVSAYSLRAAICYRKTQRIADLLLKIFRAEDIEFLLQRDWVQRMWTFQEIILASNPILLCGNSSVEWAVFIQGIEFYYDTRLAFDSSLSGGMEPLRSAILKKFNIHRSQPPNPPMRMNSAAIQSFRAWRALFRTWMAVPRPSRRNKNGFRISSEAWLYSVVEYQEIIVNLTLWLRLRMVAAPCLMVLASIALGFGFGWGVQENFLFAVAFPFGVGLSAVLLGSLWVLTLKYVHRHSLNGRLYQDLRIGQGSALSGLVRAMRERQVSDPKDKSFALHGILARIFRDSLSKPDYRDSLGQVYQKLFCDFLAWRPSAINFLLDAGPGLIEAPTWVPDWSSVGNRTWVTPEYIFNFLESFDRYGLQQPQVKLEGKTLRVKCSIQGTIKYCSGMIREAEVDPQDAAQHIQTFTQLGMWLQAIRKSFVPRPEICESIPQAMWDVLPLEPVDQKQSNRLQDPSEMRTPPSSTRPAHVLQELPHNNLAKFRLWLQLVLSDESPLIQRDDNGEPDDHENRDEEWTDAVRSFLTANPALCEFNNVCARLLKGKRGLLYAGNNCIGSSTLDARPGDKIALIAGVRLPMVLRDTPDAPNRYTVVGPAFVSGYEGPQHADKSYTWIDLV